MGVGRGHGHTKITQSPWRAVPVGGVDVVGPGGRGGRGHRQFVGPWKWASLSGGESGQFLRSDHRGLSPSKSVNSTRVGRA